MSHNVTGLIRLKGKNKRSNVAEQYPVVGILDNAIAKKIGYPGLASYL